ncbi:MAG: hypothetical protein AAF125_09915 [Chloroflexota bacterium]
MSDRNQQDSFIRNALDFIARTTLGYSPHPYVSVSFPLLMGNDNPDVRVSFICLPSRTSQIVIDLNYTRDGAGTHIYQLSYAIETTDGRTCEPTVILHGLDQMRPYIDTAMTHFKVQR